VALLGWPAQSPDLNPIENIWGIIKRKIRKQSPISGKAALKNVVTSAFDDMGEEVVSALIHSMPDRIKAVIKNRGGHIDF